MDSSFEHCKVQKKCVLWLQSDLRVGYMGWCWGAISTRVLTCLREVCFPSYQTLPANDGSRLATRKRMCALVSIREVGGFSLFEKRIFSSFFLKKIRGERPLTGWLKTIVCSFSYCDDTPIIYRSIRQPPLYIVLLDCVGLEIDNYNISRWVCLPLLWWVCTRQ